MKLTAEIVKEAGFKAGAGDIGIANIERFVNAPRAMHPKNIFPDCKSVITIVKPIPRGLYRGITEGTYWSDYSFHGYNRLNTLYRPLVSYNLSRFIEDNGYEAVPVYPAVPERTGACPPVSPDRPAPDINLNARIVAVACGVGEIGWSKVLLTKKYGPRVRLGTILTDAELEPDPLVEPGSLCTKCMRCAKDCLGAIPKKDERPTIKIQIEDKVYEWGDVHMGRCTLTHHGLNWEVSPFLKKDLPGLDLNVRKTNISEESAYKVTYPLADANWVPSPESPNGTIVNYYKQIKAHVGYFAVCGAKGCIRGCMDVLEKTKRIEQCNFVTKVSPRPAWKLPPPQTDKTGGIAEGKFPELFNLPDKKPGSWE